MKKPHWLGDDSTHCYKQTQKDYDNHKDSLSLKQDIQYSTEAYFSQATNKSSVLPDTNVIPSCGQ